MTAAKALLSTARRELIAASNPEKAVEMQRYMKNIMPFYGVQQPVRKAIYKRLKAQHSPRSSDEYVAVVSTFWDEATHREER